jgi:diguanylate cyclase (GGDEF)-like protein/PAS domain S-box-containing protein
MNPDRLTSADPTADPTADPAAGLADAAAHFQALVEEQAELVSVAGLDGTLAYVNRAYARHFGMSAAAMVGTSLYAYVGPDDREAVRRLITGLTASGQAANGENRMTAASGAELWVAWTNRLHIDSQGRPMLHSVGRDVTARKAAEAALRASLSLLDRSGRVAGVGGWELDLASGQLSWSAQTRRIHEVADDFVPTLENAIAFYAPEARALIDSAVQHSIQTGQPWDLQLPMVTASGRRIWARAVGEVERVDGQPLRLIGTVQDITDRHRLEQQVADSERFLRQLADSLPLRIAYLDGQRRYRFANQTLLRHFGRPAAEVLGRTRAELRPADDDAQLGDRAQAALAGQAQQFEFEETVEGRLRRIENRLVPDTSADGGVRGFFVTGIDITERSRAAAALRELTAIFDNTTDFVVQIDFCGRITYLIPSARRALGVAPDADLSSRRFEEFSTEETARQYLAVILPAVQAQGVWVGTTTINLAGRPAVPMSHMVLAHRDGQGRIERYSAVLRDISAQARAQQEIARQTETLRLVAEAIPATVAVVGKDLHYRFANSAFLRWCGLPAGDVIGRHGREVLGAPEFERRWPWIERALQGQQVSFQMDQPLAGANRSLAITYVPLRLDSGDLDGFVAVALDITLQKQEEQRLKALAHRDVLTDLLNRAGFESALNGPQTAGLSLAVLYIDLDHFKPVNDTHGHPVGDEVLKRFGERLSHLVRPTDLVARLGGDEFAVAVLGLPARANAATVADKLLAAARTPFAIGPLTVVIGASIGVAYAEPQEADWRRLLVQADEQLLRAKAAGRGRQFIDMR